MRPVYYLGAEDHDLEGRSGRIDVCVLFGVCVATCFVFTLLCRGMGGLATVPGGVYRITVKRASRGVRIWRWICREA